MKILKSTSQTTGQNIFFFFAVFLIACVIILWFVYTLLLGKVVVKVTKNNVPN